MPRALPNTVACAVACMDMWRVRPPKRCSTGRLLWISNLPTSGTGIRTDRVGGSSNFGCFPRRWSHVFRRPPIGRSRERCCRGCRSGHVQPIEAPRRPSGRVCDGFPADSWRRRVVLVLGQPQRVRWGAALPSLSADRAFGQTLREPCKISQKLRQSIPLDECPRVGRQHRVAFGCAWPRLSLD